MGSKPKRLTHRDYSVGWICALPKELTVAIAMLDEEHERLSPASDRDDNTYVFGEIGTHNIVIACMPMGMTGNAPAALVAKDLLHSFRHLQFFLMVGIGGGAPNEQNDIRLGDVVVSAPTGQHGGVVQYDFGKTLAEGRLYRTGTLNRPPNVLLSTLSYLKSTYELLGYPKILKHLSTVISRYPHRATTFSYPEDISDTLFEADYDHARPLHPCEAGCDYRRVIARVVRPNNFPCVFFGNIASANQVMRHGLTRDRIAREHNVLCFEMEAAGLMDQLPCLVIRGISDYADSHKDDRWQDYASAVAAAFAKDLLLVTPARALGDLHHEEYVRRQITRSRDTDIPGAMNSQSTLDNNRTGTNRFLTPQSSTYSSLDASPNILPDPPRSLGPRYKIMPSSYFEVGKIFSVVWFRESSALASAEETFLRGTFGEPIASPSKLMVVFKTNSKLSWCFPIGPFNDRGADPSKLATICVQGTAPLRRQYEPPITRDYLEFVPARSGLIFQTSSVNFGKIYSVEHNVKVLEIGRIASGSIAKFMAYGNIETSLQ
ncbi:hypothetical protein RU639_007490 [Aspergillus parasiticus]